MKRAEFATLREASEFADRHAARHGMPWQGARVGGGVPVPADVGVVRRFADPVIEKAVPIVELSDDEAAQYETREVIAFDGSRVTVTAKETITIKDADAKADLEVVARIR